MQSEQLKVGLGLRAKLALELIERRPDNITFVEIHPENYLERGGSVARHLAGASAIWPVRTHGLTMGFGSPTRFDPDVLRATRGLLESLKAPYHTDHLCFGESEGVFAHELLPLPFTDESVSITSDRIKEMQDGLGVPVAFENLSYYAHYGEGHRDECGFMLDVLEASGAGMLLDVNNVYVNSQNHGFDPQAFIDRLPLDRVMQIHVAGHQVKPDGFRIDTHGEAICDPVYELLEYTLERSGPVAVLLERDGNFPTLDELIGEVDQLTEIWNRATPKAGAS